MWDVFYRRGVFVVQILLYREINVVADILAKTGPTLQLNEDKCLMML